MHVQDRSRLTVQHGAALHLDAPQVPISLAAIPPPVRDRACSVRQRTDRNVQRAVQRTDVQRVRRATRSSEMLRQLLMRALRTITMSRAAIFTWSQ